MVRTVLKYGIQRTGFNNQEKCEMSTGFLAAYKKKLLSGNPIFRGPNLEDGKKERSHGYRKQT